MNKNLMYFVFAPALIVGFFSMLSFVTYGGAPSFGLVSVVFLTSGINGVYVLLSQYVLDRKKLKSIFIFIYIVLFVGVYFYFDNVQG